MKKQKKKDDGNKRLVRKGARTSTRIKHTEEEIRHVNLMPLFPVLFDPSQANCRSSSEKEGTVSRNRRSRRCQNTPAPYRCQGMKDQGPVHHAIRGSSIDRA